VRHEINHRAFSARYLCLSEWAFAIQHGVMKSPPARVALPLVIGFIVLVADQLVKHWVSVSLDGTPQPNPSVLGGWISLLYTVNHGAAFGVLAGNDSAFVAVAAVVLLVMLFSIMLFPARRTTTLCSLGLQMGGAAGNMVDRVRNGYVVDFFYIRPLPVFNVADLAIVSGACLLAWVWIGQDSPGSRHLLEGS
jgi:signal peptidase II